MNPSTPRKFQYIIQFAVHLLTPEAVYATALLGKISCSRGDLLLLLGMQTAVELDNQAPFDTGRSCLLAEEATMASFCEEYDIQPKLHARLLARATA